MAALGEVRVADVMTYRPVTLERTATLAEAARLLARHRVDLLPVTEDGCLLGVFGMLDLLRTLAVAPGQAVPPYTRLMAGPVEGLMRREPETVGPDLPLDALVERMVRSGHRSIPVCIGALLLGVVTRDDVVRALARVAEVERPRAP